VQTAHPTPYVTEDRYLFARAEIRGAYRLLHFAYALLPVVMGIDKFTNILATWRSYLAPEIVRRAPIPTSQLLCGVGVVEIVAGLLVAVVPRVGAWIVALLFLIEVASALSAGHAYGVALIGFGLALGAAALGRLCGALRFV
jgi:hypothetical protein